MPPNESNPFTLSESEENPLATPLLGTNPGDNEIVKGLIQGRANRKARLTGALNRGLDPETETRVDDVRRRTGIPPDLVRPRLDDLERDLNKPMVDASQLYDQDPVLGEFITERPGVANDDISSLRGLGWFLKRTAFAWEQGKAQTELADIGFRQARGIVREGDEERAQAIENEVLGRYLGDEALITKFFTEAVKTTPMLLNTSRWAGYGAMAAVAAGQVGPQIGLPEELVTVPQAAGAGALAYTSKFSAGLVSREISQMERERGQIMDPNVRALIAQTGGLAIGLLERLSLGRFARHVGVQQVMTNLMGRALAKPLVQRTVGRAMADYGISLGKTMATEGVTEFGQEVVQQISVEVAKMIDDGEWDHASFEESLARAMEAGIMGAGASIFLGGVGGSPNLFVDVQAARRARNHRSRLEQQTGYVRRSKMFKRSPQLGEELVKKQVDADPSIAKAIYVPVEKWDAALEKEGLDPEQVANDVLGDGQYEQAKADGGQGDLEIPIERYHSKISLTELHELIGNDTRTDPNGMSWNETVSQQEAVVEDLKAAIKAAEEAGGTGDLPPMTAAQQTIYEKERGKILASTSNTPEEARVKALIHAFMVTSRARAAGIDPVLHYEANEVQYHQRALRDATPAVNEGVETQAGQSARLAQDALTAMSPSEEAMAARETASAGAGGDDAAIQRMAEAMAPRVAEGALLVPRPDENGANLKLAQAISKKTGRPVHDILAEEAPDAAEAGPAGTPGVRQDPGSDRPVAGRDRRGEAGGVPSYGTGRDGAVSVLAVQYRRRRHDSLDANAYGLGTGLKGAERSRLRGADPRLQARSHFYVDAGNGIRPEVGLGGVIHEVQLDNIYDPSTGIIPPQPDANAFELAVLEAGFDGYVAPFGRQKAVVVLGPQHNSIPARVTEAGQAVRGPDRRQKLRVREAFAKVVADRDLREEADVELLRGVLTGEVEEGQIAGELHEAAQEIERISSERPAPKDNPNYLIIDIARRSGETLAKVQEQLPRSRYLTYLQETVSLKQSTALRATAKGREAIRRWGLDPATNPTKRRLAQALEKRQEELFGKTSRRDFSDDAVKKFARWMTAEVKLALEQPGDSGVGWYTEKYQEALDQAAGLFPELIDQGQFAGSDLPGLKAVGNVRNARSLMTAIMGVVSNGQSVTSNFGLGLQVWKRFRETGKLSGRGIGARRGGTSAGAFRVLQGLLDDLGPARMHKHLMEKVTVGDMKKAMRAVGKTDSSGMPASMVLPRASILLGPKIGIFYANLMGDDRYLTMDLWWTRTINRYRGDIARVASPENLDRLRAALGEPDLTDSEVILRAAPIAREFARGGHKNKTELNRAAKRVDENARTGLRDDPDGPGDREFMVKVVTKAAANLRRAGIDLSIADIQAVMWYYEKRLYAELGVGAADDVSFSEVAADAVYEVRHGKAKAKKRKEARKSARRAGSSHPTLDFDATRGPDGGSFTPAGGSGVQDVRHVEEQIRNDAKEEAQQVVLNQPPAWRGGEAERDVAAASKGRRKVSATGARRFQFGGGVQASDRDVQSQIEAYAQAPRLEGSPEAITVEGEPRPVVPYPQARRAAARYAGKSGIPYVPPTDYVPVDEAVAKRVADNFEAMEHDPANPEVAASYRAMIEETIEQFRMVLASGLDIDFIRDSDPYGSDLNLLFQDVHENNHLWVFPTDLGFGGDATADLDVSDNPLLQPTEFVIKGRRLVANDVFRIVHDYFGHIKEGNNFTPEGEENAWRQHSAMYSRQARPAMTTETRGQASWVMQGPHGEKNRTAHPSEIEYAPQKIGLLPPADVVEGSGQDEVVLEQQFPRAIDVESIELDRREDDAEYTLLDADGEVIARVTIFFEGDVLFVDKIVGPSGSLDRQSVKEDAGSLGVAGVRMLARRIRKDFPEASAVGGMRVTGVRGRKDSPIGEAVVLLRQAMKDELGGRPPRGEIRFSKGGRKFDISIFESEDPSTIIHELFHYHVEVLRQLATDPQANDQVKKDWSDLLEFVDAKPGDELTAAQQEKLADAFEQYLREGIAPSPEMQGLFTVIKGWMVEVYGAIKELVQLTPQVRSVFDRMFQADQSVQAARQELNLSPIAEIAEGMTREQREEYIAAQEAALREAQDDLRSTLMGEEQRVKEWFEEQREAVEREVEEEFAKSPVMQALHFFTTGRLIGDDATAPELMTDRESGRNVGLRLSKKIILERYGKKMLDSLPKDPYVYTSRPDREIDPDEIADIFGFLNGTELVEALSGARRYKDALAEAVQRRIDARFGDMMKDPEKLKAEALDAAQSDKQIEVLILELQYLQNRLRPRRGTRRAQPFGKDELKAAAQRVVDSMQVSKLKPWVYQRNAQKHGRLAREAAASGNLGKMFDEINLQLWNTLLYRTTRDAQKEAEGTHSFFRRMQKPPAQARLGKAGRDYQAQVNALLEKFELRQTTQKGLDRRINLRKWIEQQEADGLEAIIDPGLQDRAKTHFRELTMTELRALRDGIKNIYGLAKLKTELQTATGKRDFESTIDALVEAAVENVHSSGKFPADAGKRRQRRSGVLGATKDKFAAIDASLLKMEAVIVDILDGGDPNGVWTQTVWRPIADAQKASQDKMHEVVMRVHRAFGKLPDSRRREIMTGSVMIESAGETISKEAVLLVALNWGNESNRSKIVRGGIGMQRWNPSVIDEILSTLTKEDWALVQELWDTINSLWPEIEALETRLTGVAPPKVEPMPFVREFEDGSTLRVKGGYFPVMYSPTASMPISSEANANQVLFDHRYVRAMTAHGHVNARIESFATTIDTSLDAITRHLSQVVHDLTHREAVLQAHKVLSNERVKNTLLDRLGEHKYDRMIEWIKRIANDSVVTGNDRAMLKIMRWMRSNFTVFVMGYKATTALQNFANIFNVLQPRKGVKLGSFVKAAKDFIVDHQTQIAFVNETSNEMKHRFTNMDRDVRMAIDRLGLVGSLAQSKLAKADQFVKSHAFKPIMWTDSAVAYPTWLAAFREASDRGLNSTEARNHADTVITRTLSAGANKDLASVQAGDEAQKWMSMFYTFFSGLYARHRILAHDIHTSHREGQLLRNLPGHAMELMMVSLIPLILAEFLSGRAPSFEDEPEEWWEWAKFEAMFYPFALVPIMREFASGIEGAVTGQRRSIQHGPLGSIGEAQIRSWTKALSKDAGLDDKIEAAAEGTGTLTGIPPAQLIITLGYLHDVVTGKETPKHTGEFLRNMTFRRKKEPKKKRTVQ